MSLWGGIEAGGTKFVCALGTGPDDLREEVEFPTRTPEETIARVIEFFQRQMERIAPLKAIGVGSFGPIDTNPTSPTYGYITSTPKPGWTNTEFAGTIGRNLAVPIFFDTDVNAAALGEYRWGAAQGLDTFVYITVGTGIGGGAVVNGRFIQGLIHPEMGHVFVPHNLKSDPYPGFCSFHGDCLQGLAAGPAIEDRWGQRPDKLPPDHPAWRLEAHYLAMGLANLVFTISPQRIIMGGGVMRQRQLFPLIRSKLQEIIKGYLVAPALSDQIEDYIIPPALGNKAGVLGAIALAQRGSGE
jgi:fructokinase